MRDVSKPALARAAGLPDSPGFDLLAELPNGGVRRIEVKGRRDRGGVHVTGNEWTQACRLADSYWLYVTWNCATPEPTMVRIQNPFAKLLASERASTTYTISHKSLNGRVGANLNGGTTDEWEPFTHGRDDSKSSRSVPMLAELVLGGHGSDEYRGPSRVHRGYSALCPMGGVRIGWRTVAGWKRMSPWPRSSSWTSSSAARSSPANRVSSLFSA